MDGSVNSYKHIHITKMEMADGWMNVVEWLDGRMVLVIYQVYREEHLASKLRSQHHQGLSQSLSSVFLIHTYLGTYTYIHSYIYVCAYIHISSKIIEHTYTCTYSMYG